MKTTKSGRFGQLLGIGAKIVGQSVAGVFNSQTKLQTRIEQAKLLAETLAELKGASMKFGQMLSIQGEHLLPPEVAEILSKLQDSAPAFSSNEMWAIVKSELGEKSKGIDFDPDSLASASIGQVHSVVLPDGTKAVMKIQYPGIDLAVNSEVAVLKTVLKLVSKVYVGELEVEPLIAEIRDLLEQEVDYLHEGRSLVYFKEKIEIEPEFKGKLIVPHYFPEFSTKKVLCMSEEKGLSFRDYCESGATKQEKGEVGRLLFLLYLKEVYDYRTVQTDPNFGNYLVRPASVGRGVQVVLLDFGATKTYPYELIETYKLFIRALLDSDRERAFELADKMNFLKKDESSEVKELFYEMCLLSLEPVMQSEPFDYSKSDLPKRISDLTMQFLRKVRKTAPPKDIIFLNRKIGGMYNILRSMEVCENLRPELDQALQPFDRKKSSDLIDLK